MVAGGRAPGAVVGYVQRDALGRIHRVYRVKAAAGAATAHGYESRLELVCRVEWQGVLPPGESRSEPIYEPFMIDWLAGERRTGASHD